MDDIKSPEIRVGTGLAGPGRPPGLQNRVTRSVKAALVEAFERRGGVDALLAWSNDDPTAFYTLWGKLIPQEIKAEIKTLPAEERTSRVLQILANAESRKAG